MKFKLIFILFNIIIIFSFLIIYFMPLIMLGWEYTRIFWQDNWYLPLIFLGIVGVLNAYFIANWKLFRLLEREDWNNLVTYLEDKIFTKHHITSQNVRILMNSYLVTSHIESIYRLEQILREKRPRLLSKHALLLGIPYLLKGDGEEIESFYGEFLHHKGSEGRWIRWCYGFGLMLQRRRNETLDVLLPLLGESKEPLLQLLAVYLLSAFSEEEIADEEAVAQKIQKLKTKYTPAMMDREIEKAKANVLTVILSRLIQEAKNWLYSQEVQKPISEEQ